MDVFLMVRRGKLTLFLDTKETTSVKDLKRMIEGITKTPQDQIRLYNKDEQIMDDDKSLSDSGYSSSNGKAQSPAEIGMSYMLEGGTWEDLEKTPYTSPPELPDVLKPGQETGGQGEAATA